MVVSKRSRLGCFQETEHASMTLRASPSSRRHTISQSRTKSSFNGVACVEISVRRSEHRIAGETIGRSRALHRKKPCLARKGARGRQHLSAEGNPRRHDQIAYKSDGLKRLLPKRNCNAFRSARRLSSPAIQSLLSGGRAEVPQSQNCGARWCDASVPDAQPARPSTASTWG